MKIKLEFAVFYLDDGTLGGNQDVVLQVMLPSRRRQTNLVYTSTMEKAELNSNDLTTRRIVLTSFSGLRIVNTDYADRLGSPLDDANSLDNCIKDKIKVLNLMAIHSPPTFT